MNIFNNTPSPYGRTFKSNAVKRDLFIKATAAAISLIVLKYFDKLNFCFSIPLCELFVSFKHTKVLFLGLASAAGLFFFTPFLSQSFAIIFIVSYLTFITYVVLKVIERIHYGKNCYRNAHRLLD